jgi:hypothetical protein
MSPLTVSRLRSAGSGARRCAWLCAALLAIPSVDALAESSAGNCPTEVPEADIRVVAEHAFPQVDYAHASREIRQALQSGPHSVAFGLTRASTTLSVEALIKGVRAGAGEALCARPQVDVTLRHAQLAIWLASEIESDRCVSALVLAHELKHVDIERDILDWAAQQLQSQLQSHYQDRVLHGTQAQIKAELVRDFEERWTPVLDALLRSSSVRHAALDEQDSYADGEACGGALYRTAKRLR